MRHPALDAADCADVYPESDFHDAMSLTARPRKAKLIEHEGQEGRRSMGYELHVLWDTLNIFFGLGPWRFACRQSDAAKVGVIRKARAAEMY
jgi:hypothetical protein